MGNLSAFINPTPVVEEKDVIISERFKDEKGNIVPFRIKSITQEQNAAITKACKRQIKVNGMVQEKVDYSEMSRRLIVEACVEPNFHAKEICDAYGTMNPYEVPAKMLRSGEYSKLVEEINRLSGFDVDLVEDAKN